MAQKFLDEITGRSINIRDGKHISTDISEGLIALACDEDDDGNPFQISMHRDDARRLAAMLSRLADVSEGKTKEKEAA